MEQPFENTSPRRALAGLDGPSKVGLEDREHDLVAAHRGPPSQPGHKSHAGDAWS